MWAEVIDSRSGNLVASQRRLSFRRFTAGMYRTKGDLVDRNVPTRASPKFAYDQRKAERQ